jgi:hypothetical protein
MGLVSRQWDAVDWACVLCDRRIHKSPTFQRRFYLCERPEVAESPICTVGGWQTWVIDALPRKSLKESCRMDRRIVVMKLICSLGHIECNGHTTHEISQRRLTADFLAPRESDCSRMQSKVSSDWLPGYIKFKRPVLEILITAGNFPDSPRKPYSSHQMKFATKKRRYNNWSKKKQVQSVLTDVDIQAN